MNTSPNLPGNSQTLPNGFHGKPPSANCRAMSNSTQAPARVNTRCHPDFAHHASAQTGAIKKLSNAASAGTAIGTNHQNSAALTRIASVTQ